MQLGRSNILKTCAAAMMIFAVGGMKVAADATAGLIQSNRHWLGGWAVQAGHDTFESFAAGHSWMHWARAPLAIALLSTPLDESTDQRGPLAGPDVQLAESEGRAIEPDLVPQITKRAVTDSARLGVTDSAGLFVEEVLACVDSAVHDADLQDGDPVPADVSLAFCVPAGGDDEGDVHTVHVHAIVICRTTNAEDAGLVPGSFRRESPRIHGLLRHESVVPGRMIRVRSSPAFSLPTIPREDLST
ncbi:MAG TPA: hypothetical protein VK176_03005 [Phycisphaerales bacterium]|nr:hypothetical protein [Phycisphaerales bacterium]